MMHQRMKRTLCLLTGIALLANAAGCAARHSPASSASPPPTVLKICLKGDIAGLDRVLNELYKQMGKSLNIRLQITNLPDTNYANELALKLAAHEDFDLVFDAPWLSLNRMIGRGSYLNLETYFNNDDYPGLKKAFSKEYVDANRFNGLIYGIPITNTYLDPAGIFYRKDLLRSLNLGFTEIGTREQLLQFYNVLLQQRPGIVPMSLGSRGFYIMNMDDQELRSQHIYDVTGWSIFDYPCKLVLDSMGRKVQDVVFAGDDPKRFQALEGRYNYDFLSESMLKNVEWAKYIQKDSLIADQGKDAFYQGKSASFEGPIGSGSLDVQRLTRALVPNAEVGFWSYEYPFQEKNQKAGEIYSLMQAWNFLCIPAYSSKAQTAMQFLDWLFSDRSRLELFNYGVPGKDWNAVGENEYELLNNSKSVFTFPAYELAWSPLYHRVEHNLPEKEKKILNYAFDKNSYSTIPIAGWSLDTSRISIELAQLNALYQEYAPALSHGLYGPDTQEKIAELHARSLPLGLETVRKEIATQVQYYLDYESTLR